MANDVKYNIEDLASMTTPALTDLLLEARGTASYKLLISDLAKAIVENYAGSSLAGSAQSIKSALDSLNSRTTTNNQVTTSLETVIGSLPNDALRHFWSTGSDSSTVGAPANGITFAYTVRKINSDTVVVVADPLLPDDSKRYIKKKYGGTWGSWIQI